MGNGKILMTKTLRPEEFEKFMTRLIKWLRFPGILSIDAHGFVETKLGEPVFIFGRNFTERFCLKSARAVGVTVEVLRDLLLIS